MASVDSARSLVERTVAQPRIAAEPRNLTLEALRALAHPVRMQIVSHIAARGPVCVCHLQADLDYSQSTLSKHIGTLRRAGLLEARRDSRWVYYTVSDAGLDAAAGFLDDLRASMHRPHVADACDPPVADATRGDIQPPP
jgi:ArsR family transcriptional regulator, arsenate/arsenite/antimonite-responsive transcriptional repressor